MPGAIPSMVDHSLLQAQAKKEFVPLPAVDALVASGAVPWAIAFSQRLGRHVIATRDISPGATLADHNNDRAGTIPASHSRNQSFTVAELKPLNYWPCTRRRAGAAGEGSCGAAAGRVHRSRLPRLLRAAARRTAPPLRMAINCILMDSTLPPQRIDVLKRMCSRTDPAA